MEFFEQRAYLTATLLFLALAVIAITCAGRHRGSVILAGAVETLHSLPAPLFDDVYWTPQRVGGVAWGLEDILVCFTLGTTVWFVAILPFRTQLTVRLDLRRIVVCLLAIGVPSSAFAFLLDTYLTTRMEAMIFTMIVTAAILGALHPSRLKLSIAAVALCTPCYVAFMLFCGMLIPDFFAMWDGPQLWGLFLFGLPVDEIAFIVTFALCYPLIVGMVQDARIARRRGATGHEFARYGTG